MKLSVGLLIAISFLLLGGCAGYHAHQEGMRSLDQGRVEEGISALRKAVQEDPANISYRHSLVRATSAWASRYATAAQNALANGDIDLAEAFVQKAQAIAPTDDIVTRTARLLDSKRQVTSALGPIQSLIDQGKLIEAEAHLDTLLSRYPDSTDVQRIRDQLQLRIPAPSLGSQGMAERLQQRVTLEFHDASLRQIFDLLSERFHINFVFDRDLRLDQRTSIMVRDTTVDDALRYVAKTNQLERRVLSGNTLLIYPASEQKRKDYEDLVTRAFYVTNADVKATAALAKEIGRARELFVDEKSNLLVVRDTPAVVEGVRKLVEAQDRPKPEVMLELEVLEVGETSLSEIGIRWPDQIAYSIRGSGEAGSLPLPAFRNLDSSLIQVTISNPALVATLRESGGESSILANPRIRVRNKQKAKILVGDKVPVITTTTTATGVTSESVNYLEVGIRVEAQPEVYLNRDVGIKLSLEVSSIVREIQTPGGSVAYQLGTRNAETMLQLRDGETQVLAGLINDSDRQNSTKVPLLGDVPILGRLFSSHGTNRSRSEVILLVTPHILRGYDTHGETNLGFYSGTASRVDTRPLLLSDPSAATPSSTDASAPRGAAPAAPRATKLGNATLDSSSDRIPSMRLMTPDSPKAGGAFVVRFVPSQQLSTGRLDVDLAFDASHLEVSEEQPALGACTIDRDNIRGRASLRCPSASLLTGSTPIGVRFQVASKALGAVLVSASRVKLTASTGISTSLPIEGPLLVPLGH